MKRMIFACLVLSLVLSGCSSSKMYVDPSLTSRAEPMSISTRTFLHKKWVDFGPYRVNVSPGIPWDITTNIPGGDAEIQWQRHAFTVTEDAERVEASCRKRRISIGPLRVTPTRLPLIDCVLKSGDGSEEWRLFLRRTDISTLKGSVSGSGGAEVIQLASEHRIAGKEASHSKRFGYTMTHDGSVIAAVKTTTGGRIWIDSTLPQRDRLRAAAVAAALWLLDPGDEDRPSRVSR